MSEPDGQWIVSSIQDKSGKLVGSMLLDSSARVDAALGELAYIMLRYKGKPMPTQEEFDIFEKVDDLVHDLCRSHSARCVAVWTQKGVRDWIVYCGNAAVFRTAALSTLGQFKPKIHMEKDRSWSQYFDLKAMVSDHSR